MSVATEAAERDSNIIIEQQLLERLDAIEEAAKADVLAYFGPMFPPGDNEIKDAVESIKPPRRSQPKRRTLMVVLETDGGYITVAERMAEIFRHHYRRVEFVVPSYAMSAGTVLVMSGDAIHMDYASTLGPVDPQVRKRGDIPVPALGYLEKFDRLVAKSAEGKLTTAELQYLVAAFDPAELYRYEQERELSIALLEEWLVRYKFKNWKVTDGKGQKVTKKMREKRANEVGTRLNDTRRWHSHSRGITMGVLRRDLKLKIDDLDEGPLGVPVHNYYRLLSDYQFKRGHLSLIVHTKEGYVGFAPPPGY
jgi:Serine dehydrogenase proteinase